MEITPTIQAEIQTYLKRKGLTMTKFGHTIDLNVGTVSSIVTGNRSISVHQLDSITAGMNLPPDYFYERYIEECIEESPLNWKKISPFLYRCIELGRLDCLQRVVILLLDNPNYPPSLFEVAENVYKDGYNEAAAYLYKKVAESEKQQHSERLAVCQYRLFQINIGQDRAVNLQAAIEFAPFVDRLDEIEQLDALKDLANVYRSLSMWDKVYEFAHQMGQLGQIQYNLVHNSKRKGTEPRKKLSRPLFVYIVYSELLCANACDAKGDHEQALEHIRGYADLSWVKEQDSESLYWKKQYLQWAKINTYVNRLMSGDISVLPDYVEHMAAEKEIFSELINVIEVANRYNVDVDHILQRFEPQIAAYQEPSSSDMYTQQVLPGEYIRFWYKMAKYNLNKGRYPYGFKCLLNAWEKAESINKGILSHNCAMLFERFKAYAVSETRDQLQSLWEKIDQKDGFTFYNN
ncbi:transcriptional regulator with XRE-family HTH domain [Paenibacillus sp. 1182]|uniref:helix-turn-helix domain-containing protein n=1 Tax=Paenibacillus sp. 1182 TaxID=2806565 RepID=UPI001AE5445D|nr:helix-turn-helix transcriptional regulator [Paenibacillus sp. 1182]MBP1311740.1 transcriptional regulator with XRE-family HTH domain [Paenibacillus sp. 1182]